MKKPVTQAAYIRGGGGLCPVCRSSDITGYSIEVDAGGASQEITCEECGASWSDTYKLTGYTDLEIAESE